MPAELVARDLLVLPRLLRAAGVPADAERARTFLRAVAAVGVEREEDVRAAARAALVAREADLPVFERVFAGYLDLLRGVRPARRTRRADEPAEMRVVIARKGGASPDEVLRHRDFAAMSADERAAAERLVERLVWTPGLRPGRRYRPAPAGPRLDVRATLRRSLRTSREILTLARRQRVPRRRPLVVLCDVSASMEPYPRTLLHLTHVLARAWGPLEAFTFGTRLTRVTRDLRHRSADVAIGRLARTVPDRSGGTRIGESLHEFNARWSRRVLARGAVVLLCTDGWEHGGTDLLAAEIARLRRAAYRLIWLDPLAGTSGYAPDAAGARAMARSVDDHLAANTVGGLTAVAATLAAGGRVRRRP